MMKLVRFRVTNFRSVEDSGWIDVDDVTALIGTNESGKTNVLLPLWKLNPAKGPKDRKQIRPDEKVPLELSERELILKHSFADEELTGRLHIAPRPNEPPIYRFTLDELDELAGYVAAEANHANDKKLQKEWERLYARLAAVLESYPDQDG
jgi:predicted ATP-dependent endonuclease of OLD family